MVVAFDDRSYRQARRPLIAVRGRIRNSEVSAAMWNAGTGSRCRNVWVFNPPAFEALCNRL